MMKEISLKILSPESLLFEGKTDLVGLPGELAPFVVLPGHDAIISSLSAGKIRVGSEKSQFFEIKSGFVRVKNDVVTACVEI